MLWFISRLTVRMIFYDLSMATTNTNWYSSLLLSQFPLADLFFIFSPRLIPSLTCFLILLSPQMGFSFQLYRDGIQPQYFFLSLYHNGTHPGYLFLPSVKSPFWNSIDVQFNTVMPSTFQTIVPHFQFSISTSNQQYFYQINLFS